MCCFVLYGGFHTIINCMHAYTLHFHTHKIHVCYKLFSQSLFILSGHSEIVYLPEGATSVTIQEDAVSTNLFGESLRCGTVTWSIFRSISVTNNYFTRCNRM